MIFLQKRIEENWTRFLTLLVITPSISFFSSCVLSLRPFEINEPISYKGTLACIDCEAVEFHLNLFPDSTFFLSQTFEGNGQKSNQLGTWNSNSTGEILVLMSTEGDFHYLSIADNERLLALNHRAETYQTNQPNHLSRQKKFTWVDAQVSVSGFYSLDESQHVFLESQTKLGFAVKQNEYSDQLFDVLKSENKTAIPIKITAQISNDLIIEGSPRLTLNITEIIEQLDSLEIKKTIPKNTFLDTEWKLVEIYATPVETFSVQESPNLRFDGSSNSVQGYSGCNTFSGTYTQEGNSIEFSRMASTRRACIPDNQLENNVFLMLEDAKFWQVTWPILTLYGADNSEIARYRSVSFSR